MRGLLRKSCSTGLPLLLLLPSLKEGRLRRGGSRGAPDAASHEASSPPARPRSSERGGSVSGRSSGARERASASSAPSGAGEGEVARSQRTPPARAATSVASPLSSQHALQRGESGESSEVRSRSRYFRVSRSSDRGTRKDRRARSRLASSRGGSHRARSSSAYRSRSSGRERRRRASSRSLSSRERSRCDQSRSSDRVGFALAFDVTGRSLRTATGRVDSARVPLLVGEVAVSRSRDPPRRSRDRLRSRARSPPASDRSRSKEGGRRARREKQEVVETVAVSQDPVVSEAFAVVAPPVGGTTVAALLSAVQDLARFFLSLAGSSSLGVVGGIAGAAVPASGVGAQLCPSAPGGGAVASCAATAALAGTVDPPSASAAVPGSSGRQPRQEVSCSSRRRCRSSSDGTGSARKKRPRGRSSRHRERSYQSSSESSEDDRAETSPPASGRAPGGTPGDSRPAPAGDCSPRLGPSGWRPRSSSGAERYRSGFSGRLSPVPSGEADDDRSSALDALDIDWDDSFRSVLALIRNFHNMEEPAGVPSARCKTSLASIYGLMSETSPAFHLPTSPLMRSLLDDNNLALSKFLEDQTVHGFLTVPSRRHRRYYRTSSSSFPGPYSVPPVVTSITLEKASEARKHSISLSASQVSSMETLLSGVCEVVSWLDWWLSTCGDFRENLPVEVRADFERLILSGSRALEFLASQGCTAFGNLVLSRRYSLLADVRSTVPAEEVASLRYSPLPETVSLFPSPLLDSALTKMRAAANDTLGQRTLHSPRISRKPAAAGGSAGSSSTGSAQASSSGARPAQKQSSTSSPSGQSGKKRKSRKGKAPFDSSSGGSGRSGGRGKGAGKKST